jgi:hypothetical protein
MTDPNLQPGPPDTKPTITAPNATDPDDSPSPGPNLYVLYTLIALALIAAMSFALLIVKPFYHRHL